MILDPKKSRVAKLLPTLKKLGEASAKPKTERDWAGETAKTLAAGKLEDFDLTEFVVAAYESELAPSSDEPVNQPYAQALAELIGQMKSAGVRSGDRLRRVDEALERRLRAQA